MAKEESFAAFVIEQLAELGDFETRNTFGGVALLLGGAVFAKIKHGKVWLKVDDNNRAQFEAEGMLQYSYGKDNSRRLNFFETPVEVFEDQGEFVRWAKQSIEAVKALTP